MSVINWENSWSAFAIYYAKSLTSGCPRYMEPFDSVSISDLFVETPKYLDLNGPSNPMDSIHVQDTKKSIKKDINSYTDHLKSSDVLLLSDLLKFYRFKFVGTVVNSIVTCVLCTGSINCCH